MTGSLDIRMARFVPAAQNRRSAALSDAGSRAGERDGGPLALCPVPDGSQAAERPADLRKLARQQAAGYQGTAGTESAGERVGNLDQLCAGQIRRDDVGRRELDRSDVPKLKYDAARAFVDTAVLLCGPDRVGIAIDSKRASGSEPSGGDGENPRAGADVDHEPVRELQPLHRFQAQLGRGVVPRAEAGRWPYHDRQGRPPRPPAVGDAAGCTRSGGRGQ
jgi:hypothetical protein